MRRIDYLQKELQNFLHEFDIELQCTAQHEVKLTILARDILPIMCILQQNEKLSFEQCMDLCGVDYLTYSLPRTRKNRYGVIYHLLSISYNWRLRVCVFLDDDNNPSIPSMSSIWNGVEWFEREAFDLYGIQFMNHPDLRRILTDYGFRGHPMRKDFPLSGHVEVYFDESTHRVMYRNVTIEPRENTPRIVREESYNAKN